MAKFRSKGKTKNVVIVVLSTLLVLTGGTLTAKMLQDDTKTLKTSNYSIATVTNEGELDKAKKTSLVSNYVKAKDLDIDITENATVTYKVHYYNADKEYLSSTDILAVDYVESELVEGTKYVRVEITPTEDNYISIFEKSEYASQIMVTVER